MKKEVFLTILFVLIISCSKEDDKTPSVLNVKEFYDCGVLMSFDSRTTLLNYTNCFVEKFNSCAPVKFSKNLNNSLVNISVFGKNNDNECLVKIYSQSNYFNKSTICPVNESDFGKLMFGSDGLIGITNLVFYVAQRSEINNNSCIIE